MAKKINDSQKSVLLDYLSEIERNKIWPLSGELTYKKQTVDSVENYIATQLFNENTKHIILKDIQDSAWFIEWWKHNLLDIKTQVEQDSVLTEQEKLFLLNNIDSILTRMKLILKWIYIEAEKWWYKIGKKERESLKEEIQELSSQIRWPRVSDVPHEKFLVLKSFADKFNQNMDKLTSKQQKLAKSFLAKFGAKKYFDMMPDEETLIWSDKGNKLTWTIKLDKYVYAIKMILEKIYGIPCVFVSKWKDFSDGSDIAINSFDKDNDIVLINPDCDDYELWEFKRQNNIGEKFCINIDPNKKNLSAWAGVLNIPYTQNYKTMDITRFLSLIEHELKHVIRSRKSVESLPLDIDKKIDNIPVSEQDRWFKELDSTDIEEWITKFSEEAVSQDIQDMKVDVWIWHIATFIAENYDYNHAKQILKIYLMLDWNDETSAEKQADVRIRRVKRFFPLDEPGAYGKETIYYRSKKNVIDLVQQWQRDNNKKELKEEAKKAYMAKLWKVDMDTYQDMIKSMSTKESYNEIPYEIWKIIYTKLSWESLIDMEKKDIRFSINKLNAQQKRALVEILKYTKENIK